MKRSFLGLLLAFTVASASCLDALMAQEPTARELEIEQLLESNDWLRYSAEGDKFFGLHYAGYKWEDAELRARTEHAWQGVEGRLATIRSAEENAAVADLARTYSRDVWLAGSDSSSEGTWEWKVSGQPGEAFWTGGRYGSPVEGGYANFYHGEPNNYWGSQNHLKMYWWSGKWDDDFSTKSIGYIVEWDAVDIVGPIVVEPPKALSTVTVPLPSDLDKYIKDRSKAILLGKALFWDTQVGSDGRTACATCHAPAGVDHRFINSLHPGAPGSAFGPQLDGQAQLAAQAIDEWRGTNFKLKAKHFPFHQVDDPLGDKSDVTVLRSTKEVTGSAGVVKKNFQTIVEGDPVDEGTIVPDPVFNYRDVNSRQATGRNSPTMINAVFFDRLFWDGRANHYFNGVNEFGDLDPNARVLKNVNKTTTTTKWEWRLKKWWWWCWWVYVPVTTTTTEQTLEPTRILLNNAALASQAVGPPNSDVEMAWHGRDFKSLARKMFSLTPLGQQQVHPDDSVLGHCANPNGDGLVGVDYPSLIREAFHDEWWNSTEATDDGYTHMEANFTLFWGLAVMMYESTLVSDDAPYDRYANGDESALSESAKRGLKIFLNEGKCINCHGGPEFAGATVSEVRGSHKELVEKMIMGNGKEAWYDAGFYNIGVRPTLEDIAVGASHPEFGPLSYSKQLQGGRDIGQSDASIGSSDRITVKGSFKTPTLRNIELTGPYFHNGGAKSLEEAVQFYVRGADFHDKNQDDLDPDVGGISELQHNPEGVADLVEFMKSLTDDRVRFQKAPFDHPELKVPNGHLGVSQGVAKDEFETFPAVGKDGGETIEAFEDILY